MDREDGWEELSNSLESLEEAASGAVVPGELRSWCEDVSHQLEGLRGRASLHFEHEEVLLDRILQEDMELGPRVGSLRERSTDLLDRLEQLTARVSDLLARDARDPEASEEPTDEVEEVRRGLLLWIVDVRAHHGELGTWLQEALYRDRGVRD